jgi:hypothetical protein
LVIRPVDAGRSGDRKDTQSGRPFATHKPDAKKRRELGHEDQIPVSSWMNGRGLGS